MALLRLTCHNVGLSTRQLNVFNRVYGTSGYPGTYRCSVSSLRHFKARCQLRKYSSTERRAEDESAPPLKGADEEEPIKFSTSRAASWSVDESFGKRHKRSYTTVIPISLSVMLILAWAFLRSESEIDRQLEVSLAERLPQLFSEEDVKQFQPLPDWTKTLKDRNAKDM